MARNAILIHGWNTRDEYFDMSRPTASNDHWFPWLTKQLVVNEIEAVSIEMPKGYYPEYDVWKRELERYDITENTILIGHSCGGGFLVRYLSEEAVKVGKVVLVAPWLGLETGSEPFDPEFFNFEIDPNLVEKTSGLTIFISSDDDPSVIESVEIIKKQINNCEIREFSDKGHFTLSSLGTDAFPELLAELGTEEIAVVNNQDEVIGSKKRSLVTRDDIYRTIGIWLNNSKGDVLLAQRRWTKKSRPGMWGPAVAGTVNAGDSYEVTAYREAGEEIGLIGVDLKFWCRQYYDDEHRHFVSWYRATVDLPVEKFTIQEDEVETIRWISIDELRKDIDENPEKYVRSVKEIIERDDL